MLDNNNTKKQLIMLIEDEEMQAGITRAQLEEKGYSVESAAKGEEGLIKIAQLPPALVVLDLYLAGELDGFEVCRRLKYHSLAALRTIPIIMFSIENKLGTMVTAYQRGADYYLVKGSFDNYALATLVQLVLRRRQTAC